MRGRRHDHGGTVTRLTHRWTAALLSSALIGCSAAADAGSGGADTSAVAEARAPGTVATPEWETEITLWTDYPVPPVAFRAGGGLASLLQGPPYRRWMFLLGDSARGVSGGPRPAWSEGVGRPTGFAPGRALADIVGISAGGRSWYLDAVTGRVSGVDIGGYSRMIASLGARGTIRTACALGEHAIAYLDIARPDTVFVHEPASRATRALPLPATFAAVHAVPWDSLRFDGSPDGPCVVSNSRVRGLLVVTDSAVRAINASVEPLPIEPRRQAWYAPLARLASRNSDTESPATPGALDATSFPGGVAVLFEGRTPEAGRLVDFYDTTGTYLTTMRLPHRALRIAASHGRLYVLRQRYEPHDGIRGRVYLASYVLPGRVRAGQAVSAEPTVIAPPGPGAPGVPPDSSAR
jgi:hypothetical protein